MLDASFGYVQLVCLSTSNLRVRACILRIDWCRPLRQGPWPSREFYSSVAGIEPQAFEEGFAVLGPNRHNSSLCACQSASQRQLTSIAPPEPREDTPIQLVFGVKDIAHARDRAAELGGAMKALEREWEFEGVKVCDGP